MQENGRNPQNRFYEQNPELADLYSNILSLFWTVHTVAVM
jgi:hypothetical protein